MKKTKLQKSLSVALSLSMLAVMSAGSASADIQAVNESTGYSSTNEVEVTVVDDFFSVNENFQAIINVGEGTVSTGENIVEDNTGDAEAVTGEVTVEGSFENDTNVNTLEYIGSWLVDPVSKNQETGADSDNDAESVLEKTVEALNSNNAEVENVISVEGISGENEIEDNTGDAELDTGDIEGELSISNLLNSNYLEIASDGSGSPEGSATNEETGADSDNDASVVVAESIEVENQNYVNLANSISALFDSGNNGIEDNTGDVRAETGDVASDVEIINNANVNETVIDVEYNGSEVSAKNKKTGANSDNDADATSVHEISVSSENTANINNDVQTAAITGGNTVEDNTGDVGLETGNAENSVFVDNGDGLNSNVTELNLNMEDVSVSAVNEETGADSDNDADALFESTIEVSNSNEADVENYVDTESNTGDNTVEDNTGDVGLETGDASTETSIVNVLNTNITEISGSVEVEVEAKNQETGADSDNDASAVAVMEIVVENNNEANVSNVINSTSNSGGNTVSDNTGDGSVSTGGASFMFDVMNEGNSNSTTIGD